MSAWLAAFVFTQIVEVPIYLVALERVKGRVNERVKGRASGRRRRARDLFVAFAASAVTHPVVWFVFPRLFLAGNYVAMLACAEGFAVAVEAIWLRAFGVRRAIVWSIFANAASLGLGLVSRAIFGAP